MTAAALREALLLWVRRPREMVLANLAAFASVFLPFVALALMPPTFRILALVSFGLWAWLVFSVLCATCVGLDGAGEAHGADGPWGLGAWLKVAWKERLAAFAVGAGLAFWIGLAFSFYRAVPLPLWLGLGLLGLLGAFGLWLLLALLLSTAVAALGGRSWRALWKASALLPLAYAPSSLVAAAFFVCALGLPALGLDFRNWSARLWLAPMMLCPLFTVAFLSAYLTALVRSMLRVAMGQTAVEPPTWRELWNLWR